MSTRSGKRIHVSMDSPIVDTNIQLNSERKTRSKKQKENIELTVNKRHNYVSYPGTDDTAVVLKNAAEPHEKTRTGKDQRNTLKEHNTDILPVCKEINNDNMVVRKTRRGKAVTGEPEKFGLADHIQSYSELRTNDKKKKKKQKRKCEKTGDMQDLKSQIRKKKMIRKKKRSNSLVFNEQEVAQNDSCTNKSTDSFHSAAGSPINIALSEKDSDTKIKMNCEEHEVKDNIVVTPNKPGNGSVTAITTENLSIKKRRKSNCQNTTFDKTETKNVDKEYLDATFDKSPDVINIFNNTELVTRRRSRSSIKNSTLDKTESKYIDKEHILSAIDKSSDVTTVSNMTIVSGTKKARKSNIENFSFEKVGIKDVNQEYLNSNFDKSPDVTTVSNMTIKSETKKKRRSNIKNSTFEKVETIDVDQKYLNSTFDKSPNVTTVSNITIESETKKRRKSNTINLTFDKIETKDVIEDNLNVTYDKMADVSTASTSDVSLRRRKKSIVKNSTIETKDLDKNNLNTTFDKIVDVPNANSKQINRRKSKVAGDDFNFSFDPAIAADSSLNGDLPENNVKVNASTILKVTGVIANSNEGSGFQKYGTKDAIDEFDKDNTIPLNVTFDKEKQKLRNNSDLPLTSTIEKDSKENCKTKTRDMSFNKDNIELNSTFDSERKIEKISEHEKASLISADGTANITFEKSVNSSRISITSDESNIENILNHTPVLIESSIDGSLISNDTTPEISEAPLTPLRREGTFTKEVANDVTSSEPKASTERTPIKRKSSPGSTPFLYSKSSKKEKTMLNVTRSVEKSLGSTTAETGSRQTRVMFCSPVNNPTMVSQVKGRVIKSNLKGSNKSFVFEDSVSSEMQGRRKRSLTAGEADTRAKRSRLGEEMQSSVDRLSRPRTLSAAAKLREAGTPEGRVARTKLPNFAALHQKRFAKMESLDECQQRKAQRARQLLTPTGCASLLQRVSPKGTPPKAAAPAKEPAAKLHTPSKPKVPSLDSLVPGYTRFGFKLNVDVNPFSVSGKQEAGRGSRAALPSLAGAAGGRRAAARHAVMREKPVVDKRGLTRREARTVIKGVRTNRRFELQMRMRDIA